MVKGGRGEGRDGNKGKKGRSSQSDSPGTDLEHGIIALIAVTTTLQVVVLPSSSDTFQLKIVICHSVIVSSHICRLIIVLIYFTFSI